MRDAGRDVWIAGVGSCSPGEPVPFDRVEEVLGRITEAPPQLLNWIERVRPIFKGLLGIDSYYYALDPITRKPTADNLTLSVKSAEQALAMAGIRAQEIDLIIYGGILMEKVCPPTSVLIQEELKIPNCADFSIHSNCTSVYKALQLASDLLANGRYSNALIVTSQLSSAFLRSEFFNQKLLQKKQIILRWFLCDGAGALVLTSQKNQSRKKLRVIDTYVESAGLGLEPDMSCEMGGYRCQPLEVYEKGWHHVEQNFERIGRIAPGLLRQARQRMMAKSGVKLEDVKYFLANIPTRHLSDLLIETLKKDLNLPQLSFYTKMAERGYPGPSAILIALEEFLKEMTLERGDLVMSLVTESSKWMHGGFVLEYVGE
jgi:3-oxoacyl-[acyl-carrier-protein] synthase-3